MTRPIAKLFARLDALPHPRLSLSLLCLTACLAFYALGPASLRKTVAPDYEPQVVSLMEGRGLTGPGGEIVHRYPPVYPLILAGLHAFGQGSGIPEHVLLLCFAIVCVTTASLLIRGIAGLVLPVPGAFAAASVFALHPHVLYGTVFPLSETPFTVLFLTSVYLCLRPLAASPSGAALPYLLSGICAGLATLTRPAGLLVPLVLSCGVWFFGPGRSSVRWLGPAMLLLGAGLVMAPWEIFLWSSTGRILPVSSGGTPTMRDGFSFNKKPMRQNLALPDGVAWVSDTAWEHYSELNSMTATLEFVGRMASERPGAVLQTYAFKAARSWYGTDSQRAAVERINIALALLLLFPATVGIYRYATMGAGSPRFGLILVGLVLYFWATSTVFLSLARYTAPVLGLLAAFLPLALQPVRPVRERAIQP